jgi:SAM-dependent methyltransferase
LETRIPLPPNRSYEQVKNHYLVEKSIAERLKSANRKERVKIYQGMYQELFRRVPDHPRLTRRNSSEISQWAVKNKFNLVKQHLNSSLIFLEFAPGDCKFLLEISKFFTRTIGVDISDQRDQCDRSSILELIIYDGYHLDQVKNDSIDIVFSDQLIEHLHPDDTSHHFKLVYRILKPNGKYIFRTPHAITGPHDVSRYFSDIPVGFI